jgi:anaerobic selenocysteine-containing dehydrogenase
MKTEIYKNKEEADKILRDFINEGYKLGIIIGSDDPYCGVDCSIQYYGEDGKVEFLCEPY